MRLVGALIDNDHAKYGVVNDDVRGGSGIEITFVRLAAMNTKISFAFYPRSAFRHPFLFRETVQSRIAWPAALRGCAGNRAGAHAAPASHYHLFWAKLQQWWKAGPCRLAPRSAQAGRTRTMSPSFSRKRLKNCGIKGGHAGRRRRLCPKYWRCLRSALPPPARARWRATGLASMRIAASPGC